MQVHEYASYMDYNANLADLSFFISYFPNETNPPDNLSIGM